MKDSPNDESSAKIATEVYHKTLGNYHIWLVRKMAAVAMYTLPSRNQLIETMCKHSLTEVEEIIGNVINAEQVVYDEIQKCFSENNLLDLP